MFERYTEKARRVIFFARYEASQAGSAYIEPEHLLLGILRESKSLAQRLKIDSEKVRRRLPAKDIRVPVSTSVDIPLDPASKRILAYAAEESESMSHNHIGTEHLFLGIMREENSEAAKALKELGVPSIELVRKSLTDSGSGDVDEVGARRLITALSMGVKVIDADSNREYSTRLPNQGVPKVGEAVVLTSDAGNEVFRVVDVRWKFIAAEDELKPTTIEIRIRREA